MERIEEHSKNINKEMENIRKYQTEVTELKNVITKLKNTLKGFKSRLDETGESISHLKDKAVELILPEQKKRKEFKKKSKDSSKDILHHLKQATIHIIGLSEGEERGKGVEILFGEIMTENYPNLGKKTNIHIQEPESSK